MIEITKEQRQAVKEHPDKPVPLVDPETRQTFILLRTEVYERLKRLLYDDSEFLIQDAYPLLDEMAAKAGWDDPAMDIYNDFAPQEEP